MAFHEINRLEIFQIGTTLYDETNGSENCKRRYYMYLTHFWPTFSSPGQCPLKTSENQM